MSVQEYPREASESTPPTFTRSAAAVEQWVEEYPFRAFGLLTAFYLVVTAALSHFKLLWLDELITVHIARLGSAKAIWQALSRGADPNPPLTHLAVLTSMRLFGVHTWAFRLPAIIGYWTGMASLFLYVRRRFKIVWALLAVLLSMGMGGFEYSYESRSYALFYGATMLALYCWTLAADGLHPRRKRLIALTCMALSLAAGICCNYFAVLALVPIACGEVTRTLQVFYRLSSRTASAFLRAIDWSVWISLAIALIPLLLLRRLAEHAIALYQPYAWNRVTFDATNTAYEAMVEAMLVPLVVLIVLCIGRLLIDYSRQSKTLALKPSQKPSIQEMFSKQSAHEVVPAFVLLIYPYLGWALASLHGGMLSARFVIPVCFGAAIAGAWFAFRTFKGVQGAGPVLVLLFLLWFAGREVYIGYNYSEEKDALFKLFGALRTVDHKHEPIAVTDNLLVMPFEYYAPPDVANRVFYPMDIRAIMNRRREASGEVNFWMGRNALDFKILPLATFQHAASTYLLVTSEPDWLLDDLHANKYRDDILVQDTRTQRLGFVAAALSHGDAIIYRVFGDRAPELDSPPVPWIDPLPLTMPFTLAGELPSYSH